MTSYDRVWTAVAALVVASGLFAAFNRVDALVLLGTAASVAVLSMVWVLPFAAPARTVARRLLLLGTLGSVSPVVVIGAAGLAGAVGVLLVVVVAAACPAAAPGWRRLSRAVGRKHEPARRRFRGRDGLSAGPPPVTSSAAEVAVLEIPDQMSELDLCLAWRSSFVALRRARTIESRLRVVTIRALYLDELERRGGPAFEAWLQSCPRAAGDPSRLFQAPGFGRAPHAE